MTINVLKLHQELEQAGIPMEGVSGDGRIDFLPEATAQHQLDAQAIIDAHDPIDYIEQAAEASRGELAGMIETVITDYEAALAQWSELTNAQKDILLQRTVQVQLRLLKFLRQQFD